MFDRILFNRNPFDRSVDNNSIGLEIHGKGDLLPKITFITPLSMPTFKGSGNLVTGIVMQQNVKPKFSGVGNLTNSSIVLRLAFPITLSGTGDFIPRPTIRTPFEGGIQFEGEGDAAISNRMFFYLHTYGAIKASGSVDWGLVMQQRLDQLYEGHGHLHDGPAPDWIGGLRLWLPLPQNIQGKGELILRRIGTLNENVLELDGINFLPGETITIDTDALLVLFGAKEDVSAVTSESVFFEMNPGENEITIEVDTNNAMDVIALWQNRWL